MQIAFARRYIKQFQKLSKQDRAAVLAALDAFQHNPFAAGLRNHPLKGEFAGCRSINASFDLRLVFKEKGGYIEVLMLAVGTHSQLYD